MEGKIAVEEHFGAPELPVSPPMPDALAEEMFETGEARLRLMDEAGIELMVLSLTSPGIQAEPDAGRAAELATRANDAST